MDEVAKTFSRRLGDDFEPNVVMRDFTSLRVGGVADYFCRAKNITELVGAVSTAYKNKLSYFVLGGGYNTVMSDSGFPGIVIKNETSNILFGTGTSEVIVDSGVNLSRLINQAASRDLGGLEFLFGVPGTVGGAIYGNAGAFGHAIGDFVKSITFLSPKEEEITIVKKSKEWMKFSYRNSRLKEYKLDKYKPVILTATIQLVQRRKDEILRIMQENLSEKKKNQPLDEVSAGSFFKNQGTTKENTAGYLLEQIGAKKLRIGGAAFSSRHANFLVNKKRATASDIRALADKAKNLVNDKYGVTLEEEVEYIGRW